MKRPYRTGLVAGVLALALAGAACGSGSSPSSQAAKPLKSDGAVSAPAPAPVDPAPAPTADPAPAAAPATTAPAPTPTTAKPAAPKPAPTPTTAKPAPTTTTTAKPAPKVTLRLGYFPNVTHAAAIAGVEEGIFADKLGPNVNLQTSIFTAGGPATTALFAGALDATYIGPSSAINAFTKSKGAIKIIAGATSGGAALVVKPNINSAQDLKGDKVATPQLGNTQDVAARAYFLSQGLKTDTSGGGDVHIVPQDNAQTLQAFEAGQISGAWVPEPWATRLVQEGGGKVLVDERSLWPGGQFATTDLIVNTSFLNAHPDVVANLVLGNIAATDWVNQNPAQAQDVVNAGIAKVTGQAMEPATVKASWASMSFTVDPLASTMTKELQNAESVGLLDSSTNIDGIYDLSILNRLLAAAGRPTVADH